MPKNQFSYFAQPGRISLDRWMPRRFAHSTTDWFRAKWSSSKTDNAKAFAKSATTDVPTAVSAGIGLWSIFSYGALATTAAGGAFGAVVALPLTASIVGLTGLGYMAKDAYSNRDDAHNKLLPFVWNLIDDCCPEGGNIYGNEASLKEAAPHANYLMTEASSQFATMGDKLKGRRDKLNTMWSDYQHTVAQLTGPGWKEIQQKMTAHRAIPFSAGKKDLAYGLAATHITINSAAISGRKLIRKHSAKGGDIFEFMRRLVKVGNYLQCANIISLATYSQLECNQQNVKRTDPFLNWDFATAQRKEIAKMSALRDEVETNYKTWEVFARDYGLAFF
jgi:hypothetical protein